MISIIIPIKNHRIVARLIEKLISIEKPEDLEILIVDASEGKLDDLKNKYHEVRWLEYTAHTKMSVAEQRNYGIKMARGDILVFIDADCIPDKNWVKEIIQPIREEGEHIVAGLIHSVRKYPRKWQLDHESVKRQRYVQEAATMNSAFKKDVFQKIGGYDTRFEYGAEDIDLCYRANKAGYKIRSKPSAIVYHDWGNIYRNIWRIYYYGRANYRFITKHISDLGINKYSYGIVIFPIFILLLPITFIFPWYPLLLIIPFIRNYQEHHSIELALEHIIFGLLYGVGFLVDLISTLFKTSSIIKSKNI